MPNTNITGMRLVQDGQKSQVLNLSNARRKTYAQLENMTAAQKKGVIICEDYPDGGAVEAEDIAYDNTTSQMTATNVQDAIDELNADINELSTSTLLSETTDTSSNSKVVDSLSNYRNLCVAICQISGSTKNIKNATTIPTDILSTTDDTCAAFYDGTRLYMCYLKKIDNTHVNFSLNNNSGVIGRLWGIK